MLRSRALELPERQAQALAFIDAELSAGRSFPTAAHLARHMGWKNSHSAVDCLHRLRLRGYLKQTHRTNEWVRVGMARTEAGEARA